MTMQVNLSNQDDMVLLSMHDKINSPSANLEWLMRM